MKKFTANLFFIFLAACPAAAAEDVVLKAMSDEMQRTVQKLQMDSLDKPYFASYYVMDSTESSISAVFGSLRDDTAYISRNAAVDLRVGTMAFDSSGYIGQDFNGYKPGSDPLNEEDGYDALRFSLWSLTDEVYKKALEKYSQKKAYRNKKNITELYGDLSAEKPESYFSDRESPEPYDPAAWREKIKELSAVFRAYPKVQGSQVSFDRALRTVRFVNSEGTRYRYWWDKVSMDVRATVQDRTGLRIADEKKFAWRSLAAVPPLKELAAEIETFARNMSYMVDSSTAEVYLGPVLFEDQAAAEFLNQLFVRNISFARTPWADREEWVHYYIDSGELTKKLNMRVLPAFMQVSDNPLADSYAGVQLNGSYPVDNEGVRPAPLELVKNGKLTGFYMGRGPVKEFRNSNGHGRGFYNEFSSPRPGNVFFSANPDKRAAPATLKKELLRLAAENGLDYALLVRRLDTEDQKKSEDLLAGPVLAYKVSVKDGSETVLGGAEWTGVTFRALRDILLVSDADYVYNYYQPGPFLYNRGYVPASIIAPGALLVQEMELKPTDSKPDRQPYLPHPYFAK
ncbi:MAG TPA: metallopeptidase TldD-related protein [Elusimicrobiales bacterium]|nr:metallopeptidase TldD-related protein [Elusimicrobiales bacterium]